MPLPPLTVDVPLPRERYYALRAFAWRTGKSMQAVIREWIAAELERLPAAPGPGDDPAVDD